LDAIQARFLCSKLDALRLDCHAGASSPHMSVRTFTVHI
jgi:hypothetical protein